MSHNTIDQLVGQLKNGQISRRGFVRRATALGISASAAGMLAKGAVAQEASPSAATGEVIRSTTREEYNAAIQEEYQFTEPENMGGDIIFNEQSDIQTLNPTLVDDVYSSWISSLVFETLASISVVDGSYVPALADYWETAADGVTHTFYINKDANWHDGTPVTAADVEFSFNSVLAEDGLSPRRGTVDAQLKELVVVDDKTVQLIAKEPSAWFVEDTAIQFGILPKHIWEGVPFAEFGADGGSSGQDPSRVVGSGPFKFVEWIPNDHVTVEKNPDYWDAANLPYIDRFILKIVADGNTAIQDVVTAASDIANVPYAQVEPLRQSSPELTITDYETTLFNFYHVNQDAEKTTLFTDVPVRQALHYALDRQLLADTAYQGFAVQADGTQPVLSVAYAPDRVNTIYNYDPDTARQLLEEAGWVDSDGDGVREKDGQKFSFECVYTEGVPTYAQQIPYMQQAWREVGIEMIPTAVPFPTLSDQVESGNYAMCVQGFSWGFNGDQFIMFGCESTPPNGFNRMHYCNPQYDELREQSRTELDDETRINLIIDASNILNDEMAAGVIVFRKDVYANTPRLHNYTPNGYGEVWSIGKTWVDAS